MQFKLYVAAVSLLLAGALPAQEAAPVYQSGPNRQLQLHGDLLLRQEWLRDVFLSAGNFENQERRRLQFRPRVELGGARFGLGVGGEFNLSSDRNTDPPAGQSALALIRDNYKSRDARLDLAFVRLEPAPWLRAQGGRFVMPVAFTELIWDRDLRPQGGALTLQFGQQGSQRIAFTGLVARGSHVFDDDDTDMYVASAELSLPTGTQSSLQLVGSYVEWRKVELLERKIRRQNTRTAAGLIAGDYQVVDVVARLRTGGAGFPIQLVGNLCWNTAADADNRGLWLAAVLGSLKDSRARAEYTYAKVDKDATLAAYASDDFFWATGWEGHRGELATPLGHDTSLHLVAQVQRFKDSPRAEEREHWLKRFRVEVRATF